MSQITQLVDASGVGAAHVTNAGTATPAGSPGSLNVFGGTNIATTGAASTLTINFDGTLPVASGGTGATSLTDGGILVGSGAGAITPLAAATNGQLPIGSTGADPVPAALTAGAGITITNGAGSITVSADGGGLTWNEETGTSDTLVVDNGYVANNAGLVTFTLPDTAGFGSILRIVGKGAGGWLIAQNAAELIHFGSQDTTTGVGGSLASTGQFDALEIVCTVADVEWTVLSSIGTITVV